MTFVENIQVVAGPLGKEEDIMDTHCPRLTEPRSWSNEKITDMVGKVRG